MKKLILTAAVLSVGMFALSAPSFAEDYPGQDRQKAEKLEAQVQPQISAAQQHHADTRTSELYFNKAVYEISQGENEHAQRDFLVAQDALRPAPPTRLAQADNGTMHHFRARHHHHHVVRHHHHHGHKK